jgi:methionyl-tRNA formyltransferase
MNIIILTSHEHGIASRVLPALCKNKSLNVVRVVLALGVTPNRKKKLNRKIKKILRIGFLGALNGIKMREWFADRDAENLRTLCRDLNVGLFETPFINCETTRKLFREADAELGLSLGNGYIPKSIFSIPKLGMVNIHTEILPDFQGGRSIIWPIYEGRKETGFTIHQIDRKIDTGAIIYLEKYPIQFCPTLRETVELNLKTARMKIPDAFSYICENYTSLLESAKIQTSGKSYTTPSIWQFYRMKRNHRVMYKESLAERFT